MRFRYRVYFKERAPFFLTSNGTLGRWLKEKKKKKNWKRGINGIQQNSFDKQSHWFCFQEQEEASGIEISQGLKEKMKVFQGVWA